MKMRFKSYFIFLVMVCSGKLFAEGKYTEFYCSFESRIFNLGNLSALSFISLLSKPWFINLNAILF